MKVVITGAGKVGRHLAGDLSDRGHDITVIEQDKAAATRAAMDLPEAVNVLLGDACEPILRDEVRVVLDCLVEPPLGLRTRSVLHPGHIQVRAEDAIVDRHAPTIARAMARWAP